MILIFKKFRKKIAGSNKSIQYLKYAIGEIVLVMIGILLALQVNNWNEERKQSIDNIKFLKNLQHEVASDTIVLQRKIEEFIWRNEQLIQTKYLLNNRVTLSKDEAELISLSIPLIEMLSPVYKKTQTNDLKIGDGTLVSISNDLNRSYHNYLETTQSNNIVVGKLGESLQAAVLQGVFPEVDLVYGDSLNAREKNVAHFNFEKIRNDRSVKNAINRSISYRNVAIRYLIGQKKMANEVLNHLDQVLKAPR